MLPLCRWHCHRQRCTSACAARLACMSMLMKMQDDSKASDKMGKICVMQCARQAYTCVPPPHTRTLQMGACLCQTFQYVWQGRQGGSGAGRVRHHFQLIKFHDDSRLVVCRLLQPCRKARKEAIWGVRIHIADCFGQLLPLFTRELRHVGAPPEDGLTGASARQLRCVRLSRVVAWS